MIFVDLLPAEYHTKKIVLPDPLKKAAWVLAGLVFVGWVAAWYDLQIFKADLAKMKQEYESIQPKAQEAADFLRAMKEEIVPKYEFLKKFDRPGSEWDRLLGLVSESVPANVWLSLLNVSREKALAIDIEGFAQSSEGLSPVESIGQLVTRIQKGLAIQIGQGRQDAFETETFTSQTEREGASLIGFRVAVREKSPGGGEA